MTRVSWKKWLLGIFVAFLLLLQLTYLFFDVRKDTHGAAECVTDYYVAAMMPCQEYEEPFQLHLPDPLPVYRSGTSVFDNAAQMDIEPLYPLLLRWTYQLLSRWNVNFSIIPRLLNLCFLLSTWLALYFIARRLIKDPLHALLPPLVFGFSVETVLSLLWTNTQMLGILTAVLTLAALLRVTEAPRAKLPYLLLFLTSLGSFLADYAFVFFPFCAVAVFEIFALARRRFISAVTVPLVTLGGILTGFLIFPAALDLFSSMKIVPVHEPYLLRLAEYCQYLYDDLFGELFVWVLALIAPSELVLLCIRIAKSRFIHVSAESAEENGETANDASARAEVRSAVRGTGTARAAKLSDSIIAFLIPFLSVVLFIPVLGLIPAWPAYYSYYFSVPYLIEPIVLLCSSVYCYQAICRMGAKPVVALWLSVTICLILTLSAFWYISMLYNYPPLPLFT